MFTCITDITYPQGALVFSGGGILALGDRYHDQGRQALAWRTMLRQQVRTAIDLSIITTAGTITLSGDSINLGTGNLSLNSGGFNITFWVDITLTGGAISLTGAIDRPLPVTTALPSMLRVC